jgi:hypothetical protein
MQRENTMEELSLLVNELEITGKFESNFILKVILNILIYRRR